MAVSKERTLFASLCILSLILLQMKMLSSVPERVKMILNAKHKMIFARDSLTRPESHAEAVFDGDINTSWKITFNRKANSTSKSYLPGDDSNFLQMELSLTHFPGRPPVPNPLKEIILWPGYYESGIFSKKYARPSLARLIFFKQELVDIDREFRLPEAPQFAAEKTIRIPDGGGPVAIPVDFLPAIENSEKFPENIYQIWLRMEVLEIYPGNQFTNELSVAEIDYINRIKDHDKYSSDHKNF